MRKLICASFLLYQFSKFFESAENFFTKKFSAVDLITSLFLRRSCKLFFYYSLILFFLFGKL